MKLKVDLNVIPGVPNKNGALYSKNVLKKAFKEYMEKPNRFGTYNPKNDDLLTFQLKDIAYRIIDITEKENGYDATIEILQTPTGIELLKELKEPKNKIKVGMSIAGIATIKNKKVKKDITISHTRLLKQNKG